ncbi:MAG: dTDP-4-dehydrorhamnose 3,5-epimerase [Chloroflexi bacterium]|nr:dTDP-4-dehydrorhamnose 3,5-epimerase [Chloroflexota bacterium]
MPDIQESNKIQGVQIVKLHGFEDNRGRFMETFRKEWFPQRTWENLQTNRSDSKANVLRGLHYHFHQVDYWYVPFGNIRAALLDIRPLSPTYLATQTIDLDNETGLFIPVGIAHGFVALTDVTMMYVVDNYYDSTDEYGVRWNDAAINMPWGVENPMVSDRDASNPLFADIPPEHLPE